MGKPTGFMEITRQTSLELPPEERTRNFNEFHVPLHTDEQQAQGAQQNAGQQQSNQGAQSNGGNGASQPEDVEFEEVK